MIIDNLIISIVCCKNEEIFLHKKFFQEKAQWTPALKITLSRKTTIKP